MTTTDLANRRLLDSQLRRVDRLWTRFEETGEECWLTAATEADRFYRRMKESS